MADTTSSYTLLSGPRQYVLLYNLVSDGTDRTTTLIDKSGLVTPRGAEPDKLVINSVKWAAQGFTALKLYFDHTADDLALVLPGNFSGKLCLKDYGGLKDPASSGGTGDLILVTTGATAGDSFTLVVECLITS